MTLLKTLLATALVAASLVSGAHAQDRTIKFAFQNQKDHPQAQGAQKFADLVAAGEVRGDVDIAGLVEEILAMMDGLQIQWLRFPEQVDLVARFDAYIARVEAAIRT